METGKEIWVQNGRMFNKMQGPITSYDTPPKGVYKVGVSMMGFYIEHVMDEFTFDYKVYGLQTQFINHVIKTYKETKSGNIGILFNGTKGTGKTVTAKMLANMLELPVIIVQNMGDSNQSMMNYLSTEINFDCVFFFDEFEKTFKKDISILSFMDGVYNTKSRKVFLLTTNNLAIDENLLGRPSRIMYLKKFGNLPKEVVSEFLDDTLVDKSAKQEVMDFIDTLTISTIDILKSVVKEINIHGISDFKESRKFFNVETENYSYRCYRASGYYDVTEDPTKDARTVSIKDFLKEIDKHEEFNLIKPPSYKDPDNPTEEERKAVEEYVEKKRKLRLRHGGIYYVSSEKKWDTIKPGDYFDEERVIDIDVKKHVIVTTDDEDTLYFFLIKNPDGRPSLYNEVYGYSDLGYMM